MFSVTDDTSDVTKHPDAQIKHPDTQLREFLVSFLISFGSQLFNDEVQFSMRIWINSNIESWCWKELQKSSRLAFFKVQMMTH